MTAVELPSSALSLAISAVRVSFALPRKNFPRARQADFFDGAAGLAGVPGIKRGELAGERVPISLGQNRFRAEQRRDGVGLQRGNRIGPGRIDALRERQRRRGADLRQRQAGDVGVIARQIFRAQRGVFFFVAVQRADRARIKSRQPAARKIILHLGLDGLDGGGGGLGVQRPAAAPTRRPRLFSTSPNKRRPRQKIDPPWPG